MDTKSDTRADPLIAARDAYGRVLGDLRAEVQRCELLGLMAERARWAKRINDLAVVGATLAYLSRPAQPKQEKLIDVPALTRTGAY